MKILQVIPYFCFGGAEVMCESLTYALGREGHSVSVVCLYDWHTPISERMEAAGVRIQYLDKKLGLDLSMIPKLAKIMRREQPDVVHSHLDTIKYTVAAAKLAGIRRCVHTVHSLADKEAEGLLQKWINKLYFTCRWSTPVALSPEVRDTIVSFYHLPSKRVPVIYNGVDLGRCMCKETYSIGDTITLLHIGRFHPVKNHAGLLQAFQSILKAYPQCRLNLLGDGELLEQTKELAKELGISEQVSFLGNQSNVYPHLQKADVFLLTSLYEGIPMTLIEAMGTGLPIVATNVGGVPDLLHDGKSGLLVPCNPEAIAQACIKLLSDETLRSQLGMEARKESTNFDAKNMACQYVHVYNQ